MKATPMTGLVTLSALLSWTTVFGQSSFLFRNYESGVDAPVVDAQGVPLAGANYLAELWGAATPDSLTPLVLVDQGNQRLIKPFATRGYVNPIDGGFLVVLTVPRYGWAWLQMRAWDARLGATYEEVAARGLGGYGESPLFYAQGGDPFDLLAPVPGRLVGLQSFSLRGAIPEPGTLGLVALGGALFAVTARHRSRHARHLSAAASRARTETTSHELQA